VLLTTQGVKRLLKEDRRLVLHWFEAYDPASRDAAAHDRSLCTRALQVGAGAGLQTDWRFNERSARRQIDDEDVLIRAQARSAGP
jgi:hypothetical protein